MPDSIEHFRGRYSFLSNFHPSPLVWESVEYPTAEHAFQAGKTLDPAQRRRVAAARSPGEAKYRGRSVRLRPGWDDWVRFEVMEQVLAAKFADPALRRLLLATGDLRLVETNNWHDVTWGVCSCAGHGWGDNHLGRLLMELRAGLRYLAGR